MACPAAISPIRFRSPPFKRENEQLNKHLAINQLLLFTARRHSSQRVYLNVHEVWLFKELCKIDSSKNGKTEEPLRAGNRRRKTLSIFFLRTLLLRASSRRGAAALLTPRRLTPPPSSPARSSRSAGEEEGFILPFEELRGHTVKRGQRVVQLAFGSGFKANSAVLLRIR